MAGLKEARDALVEERQRTQETIQALQHRVADLDQAVKSLDSLLGEDGGTAPRNGRRRRGTRVRAQTGRAPRPGTITAAIEEYLVAQGRSAAHANDVLQHLGDSGRAPSGKNPKASVEHTLRQLESRGRVRNVGRNRWQATVRA